MTIFPPLVCLCILQPDPGKVAPCYLADTVPQVLQVFPVGMSTVMSFMLLVP